MKLIIPLISNTSYSAPSPGEASLTLSSSRTEIRIRMENPEREITFNAVDLLKFIRLHGLALVS